MWWTGGALGFDLETDGRDPLDARIITCGMVNLARSGEATVHNEMELMLQPERDIPAEATAIHHISTEQAREAGTLREAGIAMIVTTIAELAGAGRPLIGHNVSYDLTVLDREMRRTGVGHLSLADGFTPGGPVVIWVGGERVAAFPVIDTMVLDKAADRYRPGKRQLAAVAAHYGVPMAEGAAHGATADVIACLRIAITIANRCALAMDYVTENGTDPMFFRAHPFMAHYAGRREPLEIVKMFAAIGRMTLDDLHHAQSGWSRQQAEGLRDHFMRNPDKGDAAGVDGSWPLRAVPAVETVTTELI